MHYYDNKIIKPLFVCFSEIFMYDKYEEGAAYEYVKPSSYMEPPSPADAIFDESDLEGNALTKCFSLQVVGKPQLIILRTLIYWHTLMW